MKLTLSQVEHTQPDRLGIMLFLAAAIHGFIIIGVGFSPFLQNTKTPPALEVILIDSKSNTDPEEADYLAQSSQDGGGETDDYSKPASPFISSQDFDTDGIAPAPVLAASLKPAPQTPDSILTTLLSDRNENTEIQSDESEITPLQQSDIRIDMNMEIARLSAELDSSLEEYAKRPRKTFLTARTRESSSAEYMHKWVEKVERMGNLNYPDEARRKQLFGTLILVVGIRNNGAIEEIVIRRTSGKRVLDDAAIRIVRQAAPFAPLSGKLADDTDILYITRTWEFKSNNSLVSREK